MGPKEGAKTLILAYCLNFIFVKTITLNKNMGCSQTSIMRRHHDKFDSKVLEQQMGFNVLQKPIWRKSFF